MAECNNLGRGPVVFELQQAGITAIREMAAGARPRRPRNHRSARAVNMLTIGQSS